MFFHGDTKLLLALSAGHDTNHHKHQLFDLNSGIKGGRCDEVTGESLQSHRCDEVTGESLQSHRCDEVTGESLQSHVAGL